MRFPDYDWLLVPITAFVVACAATPLVMRLATAIGAVDRPAHRKKVSRRIVPKLGGLSVMLGFLCAVAVGLILSEGGVQTSMPLVVSTVLAGGIMAAVGAIDDRVDLSPRVKMLIQLAVAVAVVQGVGVAGFTHVGPIAGLSFDLGWTAVPVSILWIVGITNAVNLTDGVDGLAASTSFIVALAVAMIAVAAGNVAVAVMAGALAGALAGLLPSNFAPAKIFLGDTGSQSVGMILAILAMTAPTGTVGEGRLIVPVLLLGYPILDTMLVIMRRSLSGKSVFCGDLSHIHHRMLARGMTHQQVAVWLSGLTGLFCYAGVSNAVGNLAWSLAALGLLAAGLAFAAVLLGYPSHLSIKKLREHSSNFRAARYRAQLTCMELQTAPDLNAAMKLLEDVCRSFGVSRMTMHMPAGDPSANGKPKRRRRIVLDVAPCPSGDDACHDDTLRFPGSALTVRVRSYCSGQTPELQLEHRVQLATVLRAFAQRLNELDIADEIVDNFISRSAEALEQPRLDDRAGQLVLMGTQSA